MDRPFASAESAFYLPAMAAGHKWVTEAVFVADAAHCPADTVEVLSQGRHVRSKEVRTFTQRERALTPSLERQGVGGSARHARSEGQQWGVHLPGEDPLGVVQDRLVRQATSRLPDIL